ncbi:unnamed protein product [Durusdinium trenchii]|uniref:Uncharacterized protein n=1 Tax=Durusdinium trenchii TaxID=1381693 RepID=A0ABP0QTG6_9DINO
MQFKEATIKKLEGLQSADDLLFHIPDEVQQAFNVFKETGNWTFPHRSFTICRPDRDAAPVADPGSIGIGLDTHGFFASKVPKERIEKVNDAMEPDPPLNVETGNDFGGMDPNQGVGNPLQLRASQVYPKGYGKAVCSIHAEWMANNQNLKNIRDALYPSVGGFVDSLVRKVPKAPYKWRHACLSEIRDFLRSERDSGRYHPMISFGLDD